MSSEFRVFFLPICLPLALAFLSPFLTRSTMSSRSSCAIAAITVKKARLMGELVSILSVSDTNSTSYFFISSNAFNRWVVDLAKRENEYLKAQILTPKSHMDALHVAFATVARVDAIVSWNFKHIVRYDKIKAFNQINLQNGYGYLQIISPKEVLFDDQG